MEHGKPFFLVSGLGACPSNRCSNASESDSSLDYESRSRKSAQGDKWSFCLTAGTLWPANQERP